MMVAEKKKQQRSKDTEKMKNYTDKNSLEYWFPLIEAAGLPVPKTIIVKMPEDAKKEAWEIFDGKKGGAALQKFVETMKDAAKDFSYPLFLRTTHTSGKHDWKRTCFVEKPEDMQDRILGIAYFSECCGMFGELPWDTWVLREMLPTIPFGIATVYGDMPVCREFRFFVDDGIVKCSHPYWPLDSLEQGGAKNIDYKELCHMPDIAELYIIAEKVGAAIPGKWSVDLLETKRGWFVTDMAEAERSYHWPDCERLHKVA